MAMIEALILYSFIMLTLFASMAVTGVVMMAVWVGRAVPWDIIVIVALALAFAGWRLS